MTDAEKIFKIKSILQEKGGSFSLRAFSDEELSNFNPEKLDSVIRDLEVYEQSLQSQDNARGI